MSIATAEEVGTSLQRGLSEWWNEETEYVYQRIERWAAFARGYNRLRSQKLSRGRLTMQENQEARWSVAANKLVVDGPAWEPRFHALKRSRRQKSRPEETRINCCGGFSYQSNSRLDSTCLEAYRYDHSIYFKTIGEIRNSGKNLQQSSCSESAPPGEDSEQLEWDAKSAGEFGNRNFEAETENNNRIDAVQVRGDVDLRSSWSDSDQSSQIWGFVDSTQVSTKVDNEKSLYDGYQLSCDITDADRPEKSEQNNNEAAENEITGSPMEVDDNPPHRTGNAFRESQVGARKTKRSPRRVYQPAVIGENHVMWPGVILNYTKNLDPTASPHNRAMVQ